MAINGINSNLGSMNTESATRSINQASDKSFEDSLNAAIKNNDDKELKKACKDFEGIMLNIMYRQMKSSINKSDILGQDVGTDIFEGMLDDKMMEQASQTGSLGLAEVLYKQLSKQSGVSTKKNEDKVTQSEGIDTKK